MDNEILKTIWNVLCVFGIPAILGGSMWIGFTNMFKSLEAIKKGTQASLRNSLVQLWEKYNEMGYAPIWVRSDFENMYTQYHNLGANGVIDDIRDKFLALPTDPTEKTKKSKGD